MEGPGGVNGDVAACGDTGVVFGFLEKASFFSSVHCSRVGHRAKGFVRFMLTVVMSGAADECTRARRLLDEVVEMFCKVLECLWIV